mmetsp:Transcript_69268/g.154507  ORF Transcript_69268/g.154507 Transcript_69268/m.154507 type:complete len:224 (+) Transcript_69268:193-864(+)
MLLRALRRCSATSEGSVPSVGPKEECVYGGRKSSGGRFSCSVAAHAQGKGATVRSCWAWEGTHARSIEDCSHPTRRAQRGNRCLVERPVASGLSSKPRRFQLQPTCVPVGCAWAGSCTYSYRIDAHEWCGLCVEPHLPALAGATTVLTPVAWRTCLLCVLVRKRFMRVSLALFVLLLAREGLGSEIPQLRIVECTCGTQPPAPRAKQYSRLNSMFSAARPLSI